MGDIVRFDRPVASLGICDRHISPMEVSIFKAFSSFAQYPSIENRNQMVIAIVLSTEEQREKRNTLLKAHTSQSLHL